MMWLTTVKSLVGGGGGGGGGGGFCFVVAIPPQPAKSRVRPRTRTPRAFNIRTFDEFSSSGVVQIRSWKVAIYRARCGFARSLVSDCGWWFRPQVLLRLGALLS